MILVFQENTSIGSGYSGDFTLFISTIIKELITTGIIKHCKVSEGVQVVLRGFSLLTINNND